MHLLQNSTTQTPKTTDLLVSFYNSPKLNKDSFRTGLVNFVVPDSER